MTDARLVGTNPEDSSLVPVAVNAQGLLKVSKPIIEEIPNDVTISGDLTVTGTINGEEGGGSGLPEPIGEDGSVLAVVGGEPAWVGKSDLCAPPEPLGDQLILGPGVPLNGQTVASCWNNQSSSDNSVTDVNEWLKQQSVWAAMPNVTSQNAGYGMNSLGEPIYRCQMGKVSGMVLTIGVRTAATKPAAMASQATFSWVFHGDPKVQPIKTEVYSPNDTNTYREFSETFSVLCTRDDWQFDFSFRLTDTYAFMSGHGTYLHWWKLEDQSTYLMGDHIRKAQRRETMMKSAMQGEVVSTTDIDLPRQS